MGCNRYCQYTVAPLPRPTPLSQRMSFLSLSSASSTNTIILSSWHSSFLHVYFLVFPLPSLSEPYFILFFDLHPIICVLLAPYLRYWAPFPFLSHMCIYIFSLPCHFLSWRYNHDFWASTRFWYSTNIHNSVIWFWIGACLMATSWSKLNSESSM